MRLGVVGVGKADRKKKLDMQFAFITYNWEDYKPMDWMFSALLEVRDL